MPKSRVRKNHKEKVKARNIKRAIDKKKFEKEYNDLLEKQLQEYKTRMSAMTEENSSEVVDITPQ